MDEESIKLKSVIHNGKYGFVDEAGLEVIPCKYDYVGDFKVGNLMWGKCEG